MRPQRHESNQHICGLVHRQKQTNHTYGLMCYVTRYYSEACFIMVSGKLFYEVTQTGGAFLRNILIVEICH